MANVKISQLPAVSSVTGTDVFPVVATTTTSKLTIKDLANSLPQVTSSISASLATTASYVLNAVSASYAPSTPINTSSFATTGSNNFDGNQTVTGSLIANNLNVKSNLATGGGFEVGSGLVASYVSMGKYGQFAQLNMEVAGDTGLNNFPNFTFYSQTDGISFRTPSSKNFQITSSVNITGSLNVVNGITGSLLGTASFAVSASWAPGGSSQALALTGSGTTIYSLYPAAGPNFNTTDSILIGTAAGSNATGALRSVFLNNLAGFSATNAAYSNFIGDAAGYQATSAQYSNFIGNQAGYNATNAQHSTFLGENAGNAATHASYSFFAGQNAGLNASSAAASTFIGNSAGQGAANSTYANFIGYVAGNSATNANYANFIGYQAGLNATNAAFSNFIGNQAGDGATNASYSTFIGDQAGYSAASANLSNFIGQSAGYNADNADHSNFIGQNAGASATNAAFSNFVGWGAGSQATNASYSTFIGYKAGNSVSPGTNNIIIGTNVTLANATTDAVNIGGVIFATGTYNTLVGDAFSGSMSTAKVGINKVDPQYTLDVSGSGNYAAGLTVTGSFVVTGSNNITGSLKVSGGITGSLLGTASLATTASYVLNAASASSAISSSFALTASFLLGSVLSSSYALTASFAANVPATASYALQALSASYAQTASKVAVVDDNGNTSHKVLFTNTSVASPDAELLFDPNSFTYNPQQNLLSVTASYANFAATIPSNLNITASNLLVSQNLVVNGTASISNLVTVTGSSVIIGNEFIVLNANPPVARYAGMLVYDSGSATTASLQWDGNNDNWIIVEETGLSALLLTGPTGSKGSEVAPTLNTLVKGTGHHTVSNSNITDNGSVVSINSNTQITGSLNVSVGITGNLTGTASFATFATNAGNATTATSASYALNATSASYASTASFVQNAISASFASTASYVANASSFPFTGSAIMSGSLQLTGSLFVTGSPVTILSSVYMNPQTLPGGVNIPDFTNALILGPVNVSGSINLGTSSSLLVIDDFTAFATTGSNTFVGDQTITGSLIVTGSSSSIVLPNHSTAPASPASGSLYFNTTNSHFYGWDGVQWKQLDN